MKVCKVIKLESKKFLKMNKIVKNILAVIVLLLMTPYFINAQTDKRNRVASTIIADALNSLPANDKETENKLMLEIINIGPEGVTDLAKMLKPSSVGGNAQAWIVGL